MSRTLDSALLTELLARSKRPALFAFFDFQAGAVRVWNGIGDKTWGGNTYTGLGSLSSVSPIQESTDLRANGVSFMLSGVNNALLATVLAENYHRRACKLWLGALNSSGALVSDPALIFSGFMSAPAVALGPETSTLTIRAESRLNSQNNADPRRFTHEDQHLDFPSDDAFQYLASSANRVLVWGSGPPSTAIGAPGGGSTGNLSEAE